MNDAVVDAIDFQIVYGDVITRAVSRAVDHDKEAELMYWRRSISDEPCRSWEKEGAMDDKEIRHLSR